MTPEQAKKEIHELSEKINYHNHLYYQKNKSEISDYEFDKLLEKLIALEKQYPQLKDPHSPTQRVGGTITKEFPTVHHRYPMLSLGNTKNPNRRWNSNGVPNSTTGSRTNCCSSRSGPGHECSRHPPVKCMVTHSSIRSPRVIAAASIRSAPGPATTKGSGRRKRSTWTITACTAWR